jgi:hypothetical protein
MRASFGPQIGTGVSTSVVVAASTMPTGRWANVI